MDKDKREYFIYVKGKAVLVSEEVYKAYWKITEHERYLQRKDWKYDVIPFSAMNYDGHFVDNIIDERVDLEKKDIKNNKEMAIAPSPYPCKFHNFFVSCKVCS